MYKNILNEILLSDKPSLGIYKLIETGEIYNIIPEVMEMKDFNQQTPYHDKDVLEHTMAVLDAIKPKLNLRMAALLHDIGKPACFTVDSKGRGHFYGHHIKSAEESEKILRKLGYEENFMNEVIILIRFHYIKEIVYNIKEKGIKKFIDSVGVERLDDMLELIRADMAGKPDTGNTEIVQKLKDLSSEYLNNLDTE